MATTEFDEASGILAGARRHGLTIDDLPAALAPRSVEAACRLQLSTARALGPIGAWKIMLAKNGKAPKASAIPLPYVKANGCTWPAAGAPRLEVELALRLACDLPLSAGPFTPQSVLDAISGVHVAFEVLGHRFVDRAAVSELTYLADGQGNAGMAVGGTLADWREAPLDHLRVELWAADQALATADTGPSLSETLEGLAWLAQHAAANGAALERGQYVLTGARIGGTAVPADTLIEARAGHARASMTLA